MDEQPLPRPAWHWLLLLIPSLEVLFVTAAAEMLGRVFLPREDYGGIGIMLINLVLATLYCLWLGFWWTGVFRHFERKRFGLGFLMFLGLLAVNGGIAYAGCASHFF